MWPEIMCASEWRHTIIIRWPTVDIILVQNNPLEVAVVYSLSLIMADISILIK